MNMGKTYAQTNADVYIYLYLNILSESQSTFTRFYETSFFFVKGRSILSRREIAKSHTEQDEPIVKVQRHFDSNTSADPCQKYVSGKNHHRAMTLNYDQKTFFIESPDIRTELHDYHFKKVS